MFKKLIPIIVPFIFMVVGGIIIKYDVGVDKVVGGVILGMGIMLPFILYKKGNMLDD